MSALFDQWGWYIGEGEGERTAPVAPGNTSTSDQAGALRANWTGHQWLDLPYEVPGPLPTQHPAVPDEVTMRQARRALLASGLLASVDAAIDALTEPARSAARIEWEYSSAVQRHNGFVSQLAPALGLSDAQLDALFIAAANL